MILVCFPSSGVLIGISWSVDFASGCTRCASEISQEKIWLTHLNSETQPSAPIGWIALFSLVRRRDDDDDDDVDDYDDDQKKLSCEKKLSNE